MKKNIMTYDVFQEVVKRFVKESYERPDFTVEKFLEYLENGMYTFPGMYPMYFVTVDGEALCFDSAKENKEEIMSAIQNKDDAQWQVVGVDVNYEDDSLYCAHSNEKIECAYCEDEE